LKGAIIEISTPRDNWCQTLLRQLPGATIAVNMVVPSSGARCIETVTIQGPDIGAAIDALRAHDQVSTVLVIERGKGFVQARLVLNGCPVADLLRTSGLIPRLPFTVGQGGDRWAIIGQGGALRDALQRIQDAGLTGRIVQRIDVAKGRNSLTHHQNNTLRRAVAAGYYDYPRRTSLSQLAEMQGITKSTLCETLMIIERKVVHGHFARQGEHELDDDAAVAGAT